MSKILKTSLLAGIMCQDGAYFVKITLNRCHTVCGTYRLAEVELFIGDPAKAKEKLGWVPKTTLEQLCQRMVEADVRRNQTGFSF